MHRSFRACIAAVSLLAATHGSAIAPSPADHGKAPEFPANAKWLNTGPLTISALRGKVVLVDFWTYTCINCINTLPHVRQWYDKYRDKGLMVVGVHTPEYPFEKSTSNVQAALKRLDIRYPVVQDNAYVIWDAYRNQYWPALYLVDASGKIAYQHFGEGHYEETEAAIQKLLSDRR